MKEGLSEIQCVNSPVNEVPVDADIVVCQHTLADRAKFSGGRPVDKAQIITLTNFLSDPALDSLLSSLKGGERSLPLLMEKNILLGLPSETKEEAILRAGKLLESSGYVAPGYAEAMIEREKSLTTYMGMGIAIPHGTAEAKEKVLQSGIVVLQYPDGVVFGDEKAHLLVGIAGVGDEHLEILAHISEALEDEEVLNNLFTTSDKDEVYRDFMTKSP